MELCFSFFFWRTWTSLLVKKLSSILLVAGGTKRGRKRKAIVNSGEKQTRRFRRGVRSRAPCVCTQKNTRCTEVNISCLRYFIGLYIRKSVVSSSQIYSECILGSGDSSISVKNILNWNKNSACSLTIETSQLSLNVLLKKTNSLLFSPTQMAYTWSLLSARYSVEGKRRPKESKLSNRSS